MKHLAGDAEVDAMVAERGHGDLPTFQGDMRNYESVACTLAEFLDNNWRSEGELYVAQVPLWEGKTGETDLGRLREDLKKPAAGRVPGEVSSECLWLCERGGRSSPHYDRYHNLLCVMQGRKRVKLWSALATPALAPHQAGSESGNHAGIDFPNSHEYESAERKSQSVLLDRGDALFLPEGWWHQVDSEGFTAAISLWWKSQFERSIESNPHSAPYALRRSMEVLVSSRVNEACDSLPGDDGLSEQGAINELVDIGFRQDAGSSHGAVHGLEYGRAEEVLMETRKKGCCVRALERVCQREPEAIAGLVKSALRPLGVEMLTCAFEEEALQASPAFYRRFYGLISPDTKRSLSLLLDRKEECSRLAMTHILRSFLTPSRCE